MSQEKSVNAISAYLARAGYAAPDGEMAAHIQTWLHWYRGRDPAFHQYRVLCGRTQRAVERYTLGMAKTVCEDYAALLLNERVRLNAPGFGEMEAILRRNGFWDRGNRLLELTMALGTGALVEFLGADGQPVIDFIRGDMVYPLAWEGDEITQCAFGAAQTYREEGRTKTGCYVQLHLRDRQGRWAISNVFLDENGRERPSPGGAFREDALSPVPLFQILRPSGVNSLCLDSPLGMSVYGAAIDQLKACDLVYDSYVNEFILGKKRLMVPQTLATLQMQETGALAPMFDPNDTIFHTYQVPEDGRDMLKEVDMTLRSAEHEAALQRMMDLLSKRCGLGAGRYRFQSGGPKTATEVISEQSDLYQSVKRHEKPLRRALQGMARALGWLTGHGADIACTVDFDDSIIQDKSAALARCLLLLDKGLYSKARALMELEGIPLGDARGRLREIAREKREEEREMDRIMEMDVPWESLEEQAGKEGEDDFFEE